MYFYLNDHDSKQDILNAMSILYFSGGSTNTAKALEEMTNDMFSSTTGKRIDLCVRYVNNLPRLSIYTNDITFYT